MSMQPNIPKNLPFLPGMSYADPQLTRYHKTQILGLQNGIITGKTRTNNKATPFVTVLTV